MALGWWLHRRSILTEVRASALVGWLVKVPSPIVLCLSFWRMDLRRADPWLLPLVGLLISAATFVPSLLYARSARLSGPQTGSFLTCAFFSNVGYFGAFIAFALFGEAGYGLCMLYLVFFTPSFYTLGFWISRWYGGSTSPSGLGEAFQDDLRLYPFVGMLLGTLLSLARVPRPWPFEWLNDALIPLNTFLYLAAIGSQVSCESPLPWLQPCLAMSGIKFLYTPVVAWLLLNLFNIHGMARMAVLIQAATPVAVSPLVLPMLFGLDRKLSNALWFFTTLAAIPWFTLMLPFLSR